MPTVLYGYTAKGIKEKKCQKKVGVRRTVSLRQGYNHTQIRVVKTKILRHGLSVLLQKTRNRQIKATIFSFSFFLSAILREAKITPRKR